MDFKELLKNARFAIDNYDFNTAIEICKIILANNENNYMALILYGVALQSNRDAIKYFTKAIALKPTNILGYQGLAKYYESYGNLDDMNTLTNIYTNIFKLNGMNYNDFYNLVSNIAVKTGNWIQCCNILLTLLEEAENENKQMMALMTINILTSINFTTEEVLEVFNKIITLIKAQFINTSDNFFIKYLCYIVQFKGYQAMFQTYLEIKNYTIYESIVEWLLISFAKCSILDIEPLNYLEEIEDLVNKYSLSYPNTEICTLNKGLLEFLKNQPLKGYITVMNVASNAKQHKDLITLFHGRCCIILGRWLEMENIARCFINHIDVAYNKFANKSLILALSYQNDETKSKEALNLYKQIDHRILEESHHLAIVHAYLNLNLISEAEEHLEKMLKASEKYTYLLATIKDKAGDNKGALNILLNDKENIHNILLLGIMYCNRKEYEIASDFLLKATQNHPNNYEIFLYLGDVYFYRKNMEEAKNCYLKTIEINPECMIAGKKLNLIYTYSEDWSSKHTLLTSITKNASHVQGYESEWAWLELGRYYIQLEQWDDAVTNLCTYLRLRPLNVKAWISLANAYHFRGSYSSALKCYKKAIGMDPEQKQCYIEIGTIEYRLGQFQEALKTFESIKEKYTLPALKGLAEVKICIAKEKFQEMAFGSSRENAQDAIDIISKAIQLNNKFIGFWRILYQSMEIIVQLPNQCAWVALDIDNTNKKEVFFGNDIHTFIIECIEKAISISDDKYSFLYHDLANAYHNYYEVTKDKSLVEKAYQYITKCIEMDKSMWQYWSSLGIICCSKDLKKYSISQHGFISALELDHSNSEIWSNLGVLYLILNHIKLANRCFMKAQELNPSFAQSWIGQAAIAEIVSPVEAPDLYRHSTQLGFHKESSSRYAYWVVKNLFCDKTGDQPAPMYPIEKQHAIPMALNLASFYCQYEDNNAWGLNIYGILLENTGHLQAAINTFEKALVCVEDKYKNLVLQNLARVYLNNNYTQSAMEKLNMLTILNAPIAAMKALCLTKSGFLKSAYKFYFNCIDREIFTKNNAVDAAIAMALILLKNKQYEDSKFILIQCLMKNNVIHGIKENNDNNEMSDDDDCSEMQQIDYHLEFLKHDEKFSDSDEEEEDEEEDEEENENEEDVEKEQDIYKDALLPLMSVCLLTNSFNDAKNVLSQLKLVPKDILDPYILIFFETCLLYRRKSPTQAIKYLSNEIHKTPNDPKLWQLLSRLSTKNVSIANMCSKKTLALGNPIDHLFSLRLACITELMMGNVKESKAFAQKAVMMNPGDVKNWCLLIKAVSADTNVNMKKWIKDTAEFLLRYKDCDSNLKLKKYLNTIIERSM